MNDFLKRYGAVRGTNAGPTWSTASDEVLLAAYRDYRGIVVNGWRMDRSATSTERVQCRPEYERIVAEIERRAKRPGASNDVLAAWVCAGASE